MNQEAFPLTGLDCKHGAFFRKRDFFDQEISQISKEVRWTTRTLFRTLLPMHEMEISRRAAFCLFRFFLFLCLSLSLSLSQCVSIDPVDLAACKGKHAVVVEVREKKISRYLILFSS